MTTPRPARAAALVAAPALAMLLTGCVAENTRTTTGPGVTLPMFTSAPSQDATARPHDAPSTLSLARENWASTDVTIHPDGLQTRGIYADHSTTPANTARQRGDHPSPRSALELSDTSRGTFYRESFYSPVQALGDLVMMPWRMYKQAPWKGTQASPIMSYWRAPARDASLESVTMPRTPQDTQQTAAPTSKP